MAALAQRRFSDLLASCHPWSSPREGLNLLCSSRGPPPQMERLEAFLAPAPWELLPEPWSSQTGSGPFCGEAAGTGAQTGWDDVWVPRSEDGFLHIQLVVIKAGGLNVVSEASWTVLQVYNSHNVHLEIVLSPKRKTARKQNDCPVLLIFKRFRSSCRSKEIEAKGCNMLFESQPVTL